MDSLSEDGVVIPPVLLFRATDRTANFDSDNQYQSLNPFSKPYTVPRGDHSVPAGLYSESVRRYEVDNEEDGFRLVLPYAVGGHAKKSDGQRLEEGAVADLFQHGFKPLVVNGGALNDCRGYLGSGLSLWRGECGKLMMRAWSGMWKRSEMRTVGDGGTITLSQTGDICMPLLQFLCTSGSRSKNFLVCKHTGKTFTL